MEKGKEGRWLERIIIIISAICQILGPEGKPDILHRWDIGVTCFGGG
jgi:hypothetical protein